MEKSEFQDDLKRTFVHISGLPPPYFDKKTKLFKSIFFSNQKMAGEDLRHAYTCVLGPETHVFACLMSSPTKF